MPISQPPRSTPMWPASGSRRCTLSTIRAPEVAKAAGLETPRELAGETGAAVPTEVRPAGELYHSRVQHRVDCTLPAPAADRQRFGSGYCAPPCRGFAAD